MSNGWESAYLLSSAIQCINNNVNRTKIIKYFKGMVRVHLLLTKVVMVLITHQFTTLN